jgi:phage terminase large subunit-like protein
VKWSTALPDWERRVMARESLIAFPPLFPDEAKAALAQFNALRIVDAPGSPTIGDASRPWVQDFAGSIFGAYDSETGRRLISDFFLLISKKNWKSGLAASIMLTALIRNWRMSGEFLILAPTVEVANNAFHPARDMVRADEELDALLHVQDHVRTITHRGTKATLKVVAADSEAVGGKKAIGVLVDELWLFGKQPNAENMLVEATGGLASRPEGFVIYLSTQSDEAPAGVFRSKLMYARGVRDGRIEDKKFLPVLYEFPPSVIEANGYLEPENFYVTNPNMGASVDPEFIDRGLRIAKEAGPKELAGFVSKHLNVEIGLALQSDRWAGADYWKQRGQPGLTLDEVLRRAEVVVVGIDGGGLDDLLGLSVLGRCSETGAWLHWGHAWAHRIVLERRKQIAPRLLDFERDGDLTIVDKPPEDVEAVADVVGRILNLGLLPEKHAIGVDTYGIGAMVKALESRGIEKGQIIGISQGWKLNAAIKTAERQLAGGELVHGGRDLMAWAVSNAKVEPRGNAVAIEKRAAGYAKIDPLMALFNSVELMSLNPESRRFNLAEVMII